jgi:hypothetical protein
MLSKQEAGKLGAAATKVIIAKRLSLQIENYRISPNKCKNCNIDISYDHRQNKFCSRNCSAAYNNANNHWRGQASPRECKICNKAFKPIRKTHKFCSYACDTKTRNEILFANVEAGIASARTCKRYLIAKYGNKCMECGWDKINQYTGKCPIELEHLDGNSSNNKPENLKLLCPSCHSLTPTYKALNKGNGRHDRLKRYHDGKSY